MLQTFTTATGHAMRCDRCGALGETYLSPAAARLIAQADGWRCNVVVSPAHSLRQRTGDLCPACAAEAERSAA